MIKFDLTKTDDLAKIGVLLANGIYPSQGSNYILPDGTREHYAYFSDNAQHYLTNCENLKEFKSAYLMAVFVEEARKEPPLIVHKLPNGNEI